MSFSYNSLRNSMKVNWNIWLCFIVAPGFTGPMKTLQIVLEF